MSIWNTTTQSLPAMREYVQFIVTGHRTWLFGTFEGDGFHSRWASYASTDVKLWRKVDEEPRHPTLRRFVPDKQYWSEHRMRGT